METKQVQLADASPTILLALGTAHIPLGLLGLGVIPQEASPIVGAWLLGIMFTNMIGGLNALRRGDIFFGCLALYFGGMLCVAGATSSFIHTLWTIGGQGTPLPLQYEGWSWLCNGIVLLLFLIPSARISWMQVLFMGEVAVGLIFYGLAYISNMAWPALLTASGWMFIIFGLYCFYTGIAILSNAVYGKQLLPLGGPLIKPRPAKEDLVH